LLGEPFNIQHTFPLITFCKPCSVPVYYKRHGCVSYLGGNHLSTGSYPEPVLLLVQFLRESAPTIIWVSRSWGLPVPPFPFLERLRHCGTFIGIHTISKKDLGIFPAVSWMLAPTALAYEFTRHEHYEHLSSCEHGLSSARMQMHFTAITRTLLMNTIYYMYFTLVFQWLLTGNLPIFC